MNRKTKFGLIAVIAYLVVDRIALIDCLRRSERTVESQQETIVDLRDDNQRLANDQFDKMFVKGTE